MADVKLRPGDYVRIDTKTGLILEKMERPEVEELVLEEVPDITYEDVGGLADQIEQIRDTVELPYMHKDLFRGVRARPAQGHPPLRPSGLRQDPHRQGRGQQPRQEGLGAHREP